MAAAKQLQDILGEHQDAVVAEERLRTWAASSPDGGFVAGRLVERERARKAVARASWPACWAELQRAARKAKR